MPGTTDSRSRPQPRAGRAGKPSRRVRRYWLYGRHAVAAALANPRRRKLALLATGEALEKLEIHQPVPRDGSIARGVEIVGRARLDRLFCGTGAMTDGAQIPPHQGLALEVAPLPPTDTDAFIAEAPADALLLILDQVSDPRNVGAILRSASVLGAHGVMMTARHGPAETGALAKAASGALETVPLLRPPNIAQTMDRLKAGGFWCIGLDGHAPLPLDAALAQTAGGRRALVLGGEGGGMRRLTAGTCDLLACIAMHRAAAVDSLNVAATAAIALYAAMRYRQAPTGPDSQHDGAHP